jgi:hypothetical protein
VDRIDASLLGDADDVVDVEVGLIGLLAGADQVGLVGLEAMQRESGLRFRRLASRSATVRMPI